jgi:hypothetical protein
VSIEPHALLGMVQRFRFAPAGKHDPHYPQGVLISTTCWDLL